MRSAAESAGPAENGRPFPARPWKTGRPVSHSYRSRGGYSLKETQKGRLAYTRNTAEVAHFQIADWLTFRSSPTSWSRSSSCPRPWRRRVPPRRLCRWPRRPPEQPSRPLRTTPAPPSQPAASTNAEATSVSDGPCGSVAVRRLGVRLQHFALPGLVQAPRNATTAKTPVSPSKPRAYTDDRDLSANLSGVAVGGVGREFNSRRGIRLCPRSRLPAAGRSPILRSRDHRLGSHTPSPSPPTRTPNAVR